MGSNLTKFQDEVFSDGYAERLIKADSATGAVFVGQVKMRGRFCEFQLHPKTVTSQKTDFRIALQDLKGNWHKFNWARWKEDQSGGKYLEFCFQHPDFCPKAAWFKAWPDEEQPKEITDKGGHPVYFTLKRSVAIAGAGRQPTNDFGFDDEIPY